MGRGECRFKGGANGENADVRVGETERMQLTKNVTILSTQIFEDLIPKKREFSAAPAFVNQNSETAQSTAVKPGKTPLNESRKSPTEKLVAIPFTRFHTVEGTDVGAGRAPK